MWVETRERALVSARDAPSPWLQEFNCRHGYSPGASNRGAAMPIDGPFICVFRRRHAAAEKVSKYTQYTAHPVTEKLSLKYRIYGLRFFVVPAVHPTFSNAFVCASRRGASLSVLDEKSFSPLQKRTPPSSPVPLRRRVPHARAIERRRTRCSPLKPPPRRRTRRSLARESRAARSAWAPPPTFAPPARPAFIAARRRARGWSRRSPPRRTSA